MLRCSVVCGLNLSEFAHLVLFEHVLDVLVVNNDKLLLRSIEVEHVVVAVALMIEPEYRYFHLEKSKFEF